MLFIFNKLFYIELTLYYHYEKSIFVFLSYYNIIVGDISKHFQ